MARAASFSALIQASTVLIATMMLRRRQDESRPTAGKLRHDPLLKFARCAIQFVGASGLKNWGHVSACFDRNVCTILSSHFYHDIPHVDFYGAERQIQLASDYFVRFTLLNRANDLEFTG